MIVQTKFKRLKINAGFTINSPLGVMAVKIDKDSFRILGTNQIFKCIAPIVWADSFQIKRWYQW